MANLQQPQPDCKIDSSRQDGDNQGEPPDLIINPLYYSVNCLKHTLYIPSDKLGRVFDRLHLFVRPYGLFIFDIKTPESFRALDGEIFVDETDDVLCLWRADFSEEDNTLLYGMDLFSRRGKLWQRECEEHIEYAHSPEALKAILEKSGFEQIEFFSDCPQGDMGRMFISAKNASIY